MNGFLNELLLSISNLLIILLFRRSKFFFILVQDKHRPFVFKVVWRNLLYITELFYNGLFFIGILFRFIEL